MAKKTFMVKDDGTVEIDVPGHIKPHSPEKIYEPCNETFIDMLGDEQIMWKLKLLMR